MQYYYLTFLVVSIAGLVYVDHRYKLVLYHNRRLALTLLLISVAFFLSWDIAGIVLGVFSTNQDWVSGANLISPDLPVEEVFFLALFSYVTLLSWRLVCSRIS